MPLMRDLFSAASLALLMVGCAGAATSEAPVVTTSTVPTPALPDVAAGATSGPEAAAGASDSGGLPAGERLRLRVVSERPHDPTAFTQGLEFDGGRLFESRGLYAGQEDVVLAEIDPADGSPLRTLTRPDEPDFFAEGLTVVGDEIIQLTWQEQTAFVYDRDTFELQRTHVYATQGWGICDTPDALYMSDGSATLTRRDLDTFEAVSTVQVTLDGLPVERLNELECVGDRVLANVWQTNTIVVVDPATGVVTSTIDASQIASANGRWRPDPGSADVLNGIAHDPASGTWLVTGKQWPVMYEVAFDCVEGCSAEPLSYYIRRAS